MAAVEVVGVGDQIVGIVGGEGLQLEVGILDVRNIAVGLRSSEDEGEAEGVHGCARVGHLRRSSIYYRWAAEEEEETCGFCNQFRHSNSNKARQGNIALLYGTRFMHSIFQVERPQQTKYTDATSANTLTPSIHVPASRCAGHALHCRSEQP